MIIQSYLPKWERQLLDMAQEAYDSTMNVSRDFLFDQEEETLSFAYDQCAEVTREYSRSFYLASALLPAEKKKSIRALYAFCRTADNIVDGGSQNPVDDLKSWRQQSLETMSHQNHPVALAWTDTRLRYSVPLRYAEQLIEGLEHDLVLQRYQTFDELSLYCYRVASTVGLMSMHIIGFEHSEALPYAIKLGVALQLTNILRDIGEDLQSGRFYLPLEELKQYKLDEQDLRKGRIADSWPDFMRFQIRRNRQLYTEAMPGIKMLDPDGRFAVAAAAVLYQGILDDIEAHQFDVFSRRSHIGRWGKLRRLAQVYGKY